MTRLPVLDKVFEKSMHKRTVHFTNKFDIPNSNQFGFIPEHNPSDALLEFLDNAHEAMNKNNVLLAIFLGFYKTYVTVDNEELLQKQESCGLRGKSLP